MDKYQIIVFSYLAFVFLVNYLICFFQDQIKKTSWLNNFVSVFCVLASIGLLPVVCICAVLAV